jgi:hypothetical protein
LFAFLFCVETFASIDITGPDIKQIQMKTLTVTAGDTITVEAIVNDESGVQWGSMQLLNRTLGVGQNNSRKGTQFEKVGEEFRYWEPWGQSMETSNHAGQLGGLLLGDSWGWWGSSQTLKSVGGAVRCYQMIPKEERSSSSASGNENL